MSGMNPISTSRSAYRGESRSRPGTRRVREFLLRCDPANSFPGPVRDQDFDGRQPRHERGTLLLFIIHAPKGLRPVEPPKAGMLGVGLEPNSLRPGCPFARRCKDQCARKNRMAGAGAGLVFAIGSQVFADRQGEPLPVLHVPVWASTHERLLPGEKWVGIACA